MRFSGVAGLCLLAASAAAADSFQNEEGRERVLLAKLAPDNQSWVKDEARKTVSFGAISEERARSLARRLQDSSDMDIDAASFLILMQAKRDASADLQAVMDKSQQDWDDNEERSSLAHNKPPVVSTLSPGTQAALSMRPRTVTVMSSAPAAASPLVQTPTADVDVGGHLDLQTAMDREAAAEEALTTAIARLRRTESASASP